MSWPAIKQSLADLLFLEKDALHIYAALAIQAGVAWATRRKLDSVSPLVAVLAVEIGNEVLDMTTEIWPDRMLQLRASAHDVLNTMAMPILLWAIVRFRPRWLSPGRGAGEVDADS